MEKRRARGHEREENRHAHRPDEDDVFGLRRPARIAKYPKESVLEAIHEG
jgi:hypothetical protein